MALRPTSINTVRSAPSISRKPPRVHLGESYDEDAAEKRPWQPPEVDLELETRWYSEGTKITRVPGYCHGKPYIYSSSSSAETKVVVLSVRSPEDLSRCKFRIESDRYDSKKEPDAQRIDYPPPPRPSKQDLEGATAAFGEQLVKFCEARIGNCVGDGECWTLAHDGLLSIGAMASCGLIHGVQVCVIDSEARVAKGEDSVRVGDVLQFRSARFKKVHAEGGVTESIAGMPDHTAIVSKVVNGGPLNVEVLEQNIGGRRVVMRGEYDFGTIVEGRVVAYRPFWKEWAGELECTWP